MSTYQHWQQQWLRHFDPFLFHVLAAELSNYQRGDKCIDNIRPVTQWQWTLRKFSVCFIQNSGKDETQQRCKPFVFACFIQAIWWKGGQTHRRCRACRAGGVQAVGAGWPGCPGHSLPLLPSFKQLLCVLFLSLLSVQVSLISVVEGIPLLLLTKLVQYWPKRVVDEFRLPNAGSLLYLPFFWSSFQ